MHADAIVDQKSINRRTQTVNCHKSKLFQLRKDNIRLLACGILAPRREDLTGTCPKSKSQRSFITWYSGEISFEASGSRVAWGLS